MAGRLDSGRWWHDMSTNLTPEEVDRRSLEDLARSLCVQLNPHKAAKVALMMLTLIKLATAAEKSPQLAKVHELCARVVAAADGAVESRIFVPPRGVG